MLLAPLLLSMTISVDPLGGMPHLKLWDGKAPATAGADDKNIPTLTPFIPKEKNVGTAVIVCPGGGYGMHAVGHEGKDVAEWLNQRGVTAFVLKYRLVQYDRPAPLHPAPMLDVLRAVRFVRSNAKKYDVNPNMIGVWGFSAGGHVASTAATHFDAGKADGDAIDKASSRPDFAILSYPVITMGKDTHGGSRNNLLGPKPDEKLVEFYSNEKHVTKDTPPTFLFHTAEDKGVPIANARLFADACKTHGVPVELVEMEKGAHGIGLGGNRAKGLPAEHWPVKLEAWMKERGLLGTK